MDAYEKQVAEIMAKQDGNIEAVAKAWANRFSRDFDKALVVIMEKRNLARDAVVEQLKETGAKVGTIPQHDVEEIVDRVIELTLHKMQVDDMLRG